jgi:phosphoribosylamine--glycine ligase
MVVKASGLAAGKGVVICRDEAEAVATLRSFLGDRALGDAGSTVIVEDFLGGDEVSVFCLTDGSTLFVLPASQDHKRVGDGDTGPNTGGMGAYSPTPFATDAVTARIEREVLVPTLHAMSTMDCPFSGLLFAGMMLTRAGPRTLEFNCRFGDPETQVSCCLA